MKILVTGSAGFIGYHLSKRLLEAGNQVVGIDSINDYYDVRLKYARLETDDMREAPALVVIEKLLEAGASVKVYDPVAMDECRRRIGDRVVYCKDMYDVVIDADALAVLTEWKEFRIPSWSVIKRVMKQPVLVDGRNIYSKDEVIAEGFEYAAIGK